MDIDLTTHILGQKKVRKLNRFSCSEAYYLLNGWTKIDDYVKGKEFTVKEAYIMLLGSLKHQAIQEWLKEEYQVEVKKEITIGEIEIVGMADLLHLEPIGDKPKLLKGDYGIEIKTSDKLKDKASKGHEFQARMYCSLFEVPYFIIMQPVLAGNKCILKEIGRVKRNDKWFGGIINKLTELYNTQLKQYGK